MTGSNRRNYDVHLPRVTTTSLNHRLIQQQHRPLLAELSRPSLTVSTRPQAVGEQRLLHVRLSIHRYGSCVTVGF